MTSRGVLGGVEPDPGKGKPHRHTRAKCLLMLTGMTLDQATTALIVLIDKRPEDALDALIIAAGYET